MQTFIDSKNLARDKDVNNLFGQSTTFKGSAKAEAGNAEEQPASNKLTGENDKAVDQSSPASQQQSFLS